MRVDVKFNAGKYRLQTVSQCAQSELVADSVFSIFSVNPIYSPPTSPAAVKRKKGVSVIVDMTNSAHFLM